MSRRLSALDPLRARVRRVQMILGIALVARVCGALLSSVLVTWFPGSGTMPPWLGHPLGVVIEELWAWTVLPLFLHVAARIVELRVWGSAVASLCIGFGISLSFQWISLGGLALRHEHPARWLSWIVVFGVGVALGRFAIQKGRAAANRRDRSAHETADARQDEYAEFTRQAERLGARQEAREAEAAARRAGEEGEVKSPESGTAENPERTPD